MASFLATPFLSDYWLLAIGYSAWTDYSAEEQRRRAERMRPSCHRDEGGSDSRSRRRLLDVSDLVAKFLDEVGVAIAEDLQVRWTKLFA